MSSCTRVPLVTALAAALVTATGLATGATTAAAFPTDAPVVIGEVYGGGGNGGAPLANDYVELRNRTGEPVDVSGDSVQYASATGTGALGAPGQIVVMPTGTVVPAGGRLLVQLAGGASGAPLPAPDVTGTINMSATAGKVAYVDGAEPLGCNGGSLPCGPEQEARVVDLVGYGSANYFEGTPAPAASNTTALHRGGAECTDTNDNGADLAAAAPGAQGAATPAEPCGDGEEPEPTDPCEVPVTHQLAEVQGSGPTSPLAGQTVTVEGVVTGDYQAPGLFGGFFIQDGTPDADPATSDGLRIFDNATPVSPGDLVRVTGTVGELASVASVPLFAGSETQISGGTAAACATGLPLPAPQPIALPFAPVSGGADGQERYEGVRVTVQHDGVDLAVTENFTLGRFGEVTLSAGGPLFGPTNHGAARSENLRNQIVLDDGRSGQNLADLPYTIGGDGVTLPRVGDAVGDGEEVAGVLSYAFGLYRIEPLVPGTAVDFARRAPRPAAPDPVGGDVRVGSFNVLNYFVDFGGENRGADGPAELARQQAKLVAAIGGLDADVVGLIEIANDDGDALDALVAALNAAQPDAARHYAAIAAPVLNPPEDSLVGGTFGTDAIRVALIYRPATVTPTGPARAIDDPVMDRPAIVQAFEPAGGGESFTVVVNHLKSKGSCPAPGTDPANDDLGQGCWSARRVAQAQVVVDALAADGVDDAVLLGDYNAYAEEDPVALIEGAGYVQVVEAFLAPDDAYSYVFGGELGELDHAFVSAGFAGAVSGADIWHVNSVEPPAYDYNDFNQPALYAPDPYRSSDHDPVLLGLDLAPAVTAPVAPAPVAASPAWAAAHVSWTAPADDGGSPVTGYVVTARRGGAVAAEVTVGPGVLATDLGPLTPGVSHTIEVRAVNAAGASEPAVATAVPRSRPLLALPLVTTAACRGGDAVFTVHNLNSLAAGFTWRAPLPGESGAGVVPARGTAEVAVHDPHLLELLQVAVAGQPQLPGLALFC